MGFYKNINDLGKKIEILLSNPKKLQKFGRLGKKDILNYLTIRKLRKKLLILHFNLVYPKSIKYILQNKY